ncbi:MAG: hypothetical protein HOI95_04740 [Chromatiales bacterium]|jgi:hypothetical protein|nr:hypothetical protein [Chromatiales bacterium]
MADEWEFANGLDATNPSDALTDLDGDGLNNLTEFRRGTDPPKKDSSVAAIVPILSLLF